MPPVIKARIFSHFLFFILETAKKATEHRSYEEYENSKIKKEDEAVMHLSKALHKGLGRLSAAALKKVEVLTLLALLVQKYNY